MRRLLLALACLLLLPGRGVGAEPERVVEIDAPATVEDLVLADVDGDGVKDLLLLEGREVRVCLGRKGALPLAAPTFRRVLPEDVSFVEGAPLEASPPVPGLLLVGSAGPRHLALTDGEERPLEVLDASLTWSDPDRATFAPLAIGRGQHLLPTASGWVLLGRPGEAAREITLALDRQVTPPGDFLEDVAEVRIGRAAIFAGRGPHGAGDEPALWALSGRELVAFAAGSRQVHDVGFLPSEGDRRLVDLDGDGAPELIHKQGTNQEATYAFFRTRPLALEEGELPARGHDIRPPVSVLRLTGYQLDPAYVDLDGDGRRDFVLTSIAIDARNTLRALGGKVTASTKAFLNKPRPEGGFFGTAPDADVTSDIGVAIRFSQAGNIDVRRSFTILVTGDYDGDGRLDLAIRTGHDTLAIHRGRAVGVWETDPVEVRIPPMGESPDLEGHPADLDGDGKDELVLVYRKGNGGQDRVKVVRPLLK